jgi:hypothetical protein
VTACTLATQLDGSLFVVSGVVRAIPLKPLATERRAVVVGVVTWRFNAASTSFARNGGFPIDDLDMAMVGS